MAFYRYGLGSCLVAVLALGCGDDGAAPVDSGTDTGGGQDTGTPTDAGMDTGTPTDAGMDTGTPTDGPTDGGQSPVARGDYIVNHVATCWACHTPHDQNGPIAGQHLAGFPNFFEDFNTPNLTPGGPLADMTDEQVKNAFQNGISIGTTADGGVGEVPLWPFMPYWVFHNMSDADADAVVAYLRSIPAVDSGVVKKAERPPAVTPYLDPATDIPMPTLATDDPDYDAAMLGRYLTTQTGLCMECHTQENMTPGELPLNTARAFAGRVLPFPDATQDGGVRLIETPNLTQGTNGTELTTVELIRGRIIQDTTVCPVMPIGPAGYWGLTLDDATAMATYLLNLPPLDSAAPAAACNFP